MTENLIEESIIWAKERVREKGDFTLTGATTAHLLASILAELRKEKVVKARG